MAVPGTPLPERGPTTVSGYSGNLEDDSDKSSLNYNNFMPSHARCTQRKGGSGGNREHDYINHIDRHSSTKGAYKVEVLM